MGPAVQSRLFVKEQLLGSWSWGTGNPQTLSQGARPSARGGHMVTASCPRWGSHGPALTDPAWQGELHWPALYSSCGTLTQAPGPRFPQLYYRGDGIRSVSQRPCGGLSPALEKLRAADGEGRQARRTEETSSWGWGCPERHPSLHPVGPLCVLEGLVRHRVTRKPLCAESSRRHIHWSHSSSPKRDE